MKTPPPLLRMLAIGCSSHEDLLHQIHYLTVENRILRSKLPKRILLTRRERRRLLRFGKPVGPALKHLISIVQYPTFRRWMRGSGPAKRKKSKAGRPSTKRDLKKLVVRMARTPGWGYSRTTVRSILKEHGIEPAPDRSEPVWDSFLKRHAATLWSCDYFTKKTLTTKGFRPLTMLVFMHIKSRRVLVTKTTPHPTRDWASDIAEAFAATAQQQGMPRPTILIRDNDGKFGPEFDAAFRKSGVEPQRLPVRAPLMNTHIERCIKSLKVECLDHFVPVGAKHLDYLISEYVEHYHNERPHQGIGNRTILNRGSLPVAGCR